MKRPTGLVGVVEELQDGEDAGADEEAHLTADVAYREGHSETLQGQRSVSAGRRV